MDENVIDFRPKLEERRVAVEDGMTAECPMRNVLHVIGGRWVSFVMIALADKPHRFGQLRRVLPDISQRMLTQTLYDLQRDGYVSRKVLPTNPPSVEYSLTALGQSLYAEFRPVLEWAHRNHDAVFQARTAFDREREEMA